MLRLRALLEDYVSCLEVSVHVPLHYCGLLNSLFPMIFIVIFEQLHDRFVFLEELQSFKVKTVEIVMNFDNGLWSSLNHASFFDLLQKYTPSILVLIEVRIKYSKHVFRV